MTAKMAGGQSIVSPPSATWCRHRVASQACRPMVIQTEEEDKRARPVRNLVIASAASPLGHAPRTRHIVHGFFPPATRKPRKVWCNFRYSSGPRILNAGAAVSPLRRQRARSLRDGQVAGISSVVVTPTCTEVAGSLANAACHHEMGGPGSITRRTPAAVA